MRNAAPRVMPKPQSKAATQDPRAFQIKQIKLRFNAQEEKTQDQGTSLTFDMAPSDPDFPFEIESLKCTIKIPAPFLWDRRPPFLKISNAELERGYQVNVEKSFDAMWSRAAEPTLLGTMKALDKNLEQILTAPKADMIKIIAPVVPLRPRSEDDLPLEPSFAVAKASEGNSKGPTAATPAVTAEEKQEAKERREVEVRILESRLGRDPQFASFADGTAFDIALEPRKRETLPVELQSIKVVRLYVSPAYPLEPCTLEILGAEGELVKNVEANFLHRVQEKSSQSLLSHINHLAANMHSMTSKPLEATATDEKLVKAEEPARIAQSANPQIIDTDKAHVKVISRPPEWSVVPDQDDKDGSSDFSSDFESSESDGDAEGDPEDEATGSTPSLDTRSRGVLLSFPHLELFHVALLELQSVYLIVKCDRCKDTTTVNNISNNVFADPPATRSERCKKCAAPFSLGFRRDIMHVSCIRAGYLDLDGCSPFDLLPSPFVPTCSECMAAHPAVSGVRGDAALAVCRECHSKMTFRIPETKFLRLGPSAPSTVGSLPMKRPKENLGITAGSELPRTGRCRHYAKSHRWFRFSCCNRVYPCDKCHDEVEKDHPQEFANRMICGFCSREQNYRPEECGTCRRSLVGRRGRGFWEGGKGTRDPKRMSRKDPRKYKRRGKGAVETAKKEK